MKAISIFLLAIVIVHNGFAQTIEDEAQALYQKAEDAYENKQYHDCEDNLQKTWKLLASPNPKILYLWIKNTDDALKSGVFSNNLKNNQQQLQLLTTFFQMVDKSTYPPEKYSEMVNIKLDVEGKIADCERRKVIYENLKSREALFIKDTVDLYGQAFCNDYNTGLEKRLHNISKIVHGYLVKPGYGGFPDKLDYNSGISSDPNSDTSDPHCIFATYKEAKASYVIPLLSLIEIHYPKGNLLTYSYLDFNNDKDKAQLIKQGNTDALYFSRIGFSNDSPVSPEYSFDFTPYIKKIIELKNIMDATGFTDYYNHKFDDVKD